MDDPLNLQAEVLSIGDELTSGQRLDTNSQWLSSRLSELGIRTIRHTTVGDDMAGCVEALQLAAGRADVMVVSGGLGPTLDDLTRQALAEAFDSPLQLDPVSLEHIRQMFARRSRDMPERNQVQAMFPSGARIIPNPHGSAPGIDMSVESQGRNCRIFSLPGVPAELKQMWAESVVPRIEAMLGGNLGAWYFHAVKLFGIGESDVETRLPDLIDRRRVPTVGITVSQATITLRIAARAENDQRFAQLIAPTLNEIQQSLGELIFGAGEDELEHAIYRQLIEKQLTIACVEIGAASWLSQWMLSAADSHPQSPRLSPTAALSLVPSDHDSPENAQPPFGFVGGLAFPSIEHARRWFSGQYDGDSSLWESLAQQAQQRFAADIVLIVSGYPTASEMEASTGTFDFDFTLAIGEQVFTEHRQLGGHPDVLGPRAAKTALDWLRQKLQSPLLRKSC